MRHDEHRLSARHELLEEVDHGRRRSRVEVAGRLVGDKERRIGRQRPGDRHPLLLPSRDGGGQLLRLLGQTDALEQLERPRAPLVRRPQAAELHGQHDVVEQRDRRQQLEELEDDADRPSPPLRRRPLAQVVHCRPVDPDLAARRAVDARDHVDERALAATGLPDHGDELPRADLEAHALERGQAPRGRLVLLDDVVEIDQRTPVHAIEDRRPRPRGLSSAREPAAVPHRVVRVRPRVRAEARRRALASVHGRGPRRLSDAVGAGAGSRALLRAPRCSSRPRRLGGRRAPRLSVPLVRV